MGESIKKIKHRSKNKVYLHTCNAGYNY